MRFYRQTFSSLLNRSLAHSAMGTTRNRSNACRIQILDTQNLCDVVASCFHMSRKQALGCLEIVVKPLPHWISSPRPGEIAEIVSHLLVSSLDACSQKPFLRFSSLTWSELLPSNVIIGDETNLRTLNHVTAVAFCDVAPREIQGSRRQTPRSLMRLSCLATHQSWL
jgi:hypothetical protein